ncbi:atp6v1c1 [Symbiodinium microadriaticum]|nr:atp6v1c1 [Symbiodinium microadriaticum]CAE7948257.1 atp6v1c1 [Symbiodinium sp. KB8]
MQENVVPKSARQFQGIEDKDGNTLCRVVMFRSAVDGFKKMCREKKFTVRDFEHSKDGYRKLEQQPKSVEESVKRQRDLVRGICQAGHPLADGAEKFFPNVSLSFTAFNVNRDK